MDTSRPTMSGRAGVAIGTGEGDVVAVNGILAGRFACREFCDAPVARRTIEQISSHLRARNASFPKGRLSWCDRVRMRRTA